MPSPSHTESALTSLAILKVNHDRDHDHISNFLPFVAEVLRDAPHDEVSLPDVQAGVHDAFSINMPQGALSTVLRRAAKKGYVTRTHGIYRRDRRKLAEVDIGALRGSVARQQAALVKDLVTFAGKVYDTSWERAEAESVLLTYLARRNTAILDAAVGGRAIDLPAPIDHAGIVVDAFVVEISTSNPTAFEFLVTLVKGCMLADVLYLPGTFEGADRNFHGTNFFLDTALVLRAIGFSSEELTKPTRELLNLLTSENVSLKIFEHILEEINGAMDHAARALRPGGQATLQSPAEFLLTDGWRVSDVEDFIAKVPNKLSALGIQVVPKPAYTKRLGVDESALEKALHKALPGQRPEATRKDVDSIAAIHRFRAGDSCHQLERCKAVLVTTNGALVGAATRFFRDGTNSEQGISPVIHAHDLTTIIWLKRPTTAPDLPRMQIIADSFAALNPSEELWRRYNVEIRRLRQRGDVSTEEFHALRYSLEARQALLATTRGDADVFTEGSVPVILDRVRREMTAELRQQLASEKAAKDEALAQREVVEAREDSLRSAAERDKAEREIAISRRAKKIAGVLAKSVLVVLVVGIVLGTLAASESLLPDSVTDRLPPFWAASIVLVTVFSIANVVVGISIIGLTRRLETATEQRVVGLLRRLTT